MSDTSSESYLAQQNRFLSDQVFALSERIRALQEQVKTASDVPDHLQADLTQRQEYLDAATGEVERLRGVVESLRAEIDGTRAERDRAIGERHELEKRCATLEGRLAGSGLFGLFRRGR